MTWADRVKPEFAVGDKVAYSAQWLRSTGQFTGDIPHARGTITELKKIGDITLAIIDWRDPEIPSKVNVRNLERWAARSPAD